MKESSLRRNPVSYPDVLPTDAVALLAGVNFASVVKVFWALNAIHEAQGIPFEDLMQSDLIPENQADAERRARTTRFVEDILVRPFSEKVGSALKLPQRFGMKG